jgi:hypothetical protein
VRSNETGETGHLLADFRRLNVAFSRARAKMLVVGSRATLTHSPVLSAFIRLADASSWVVSLPPKAGELSSTSVARNSAAPLAGGGDRAQGVLGPTSSDVGAGVGSASVICVPEGHQITANVLQEVHNRPPTLLHPVDPSNVVAENVSMDATW